MDFSGFPGKIPEGSIMPERMGKRGKEMSRTMCGGWGKFAVGMTMGMMAGAVWGMAMAPSQRQLKRAAHQAAKKVNQAVDRLVDAMDM